MSLLSHFPSFDDFLCRAFSGSGRPVWRSKFRAMILEPTIRCYPEADTMAIETFEDEDDEPCELAVL